MLRIKRTRIVLEILTPVDDDPNDESLRNIDYECEEGGWSLNVIRDDKPEILEGEAAEAACLAHCTEKFQDLEDDEED